MGLHRFKPLPSGRMGIFWTLSSIREAAVVEFGCMGHNIYSGGLLRRGGIYEGYGASLYTTYIDETDVAMGDFARLEHTLKELIPNENPKAIFLQPSAVPEVVGMDMFAIAKMIQSDFDVPLIPIGHGSFAISQHKGVEAALREIAEVMPRDTERSKVPSYNIIGSCPDLFNVGPDALEIERMLKGAFDLERNCVFSSDCSVTELFDLGKAHINVVIRQEGIAAAKVLEKKFGTPWVFGRPYGIKGSTKWLESVGEVLGREPDKKFVEAEEKLLKLQMDMPYRTLETNHWQYPDEAVLTMGGHYDVVKGIAEFASKELPMDLGPLWCDCPEMGDENIPYYTEKEWAPIVKAHEKGYLMFSGEALYWAKKNTQLQIANPDIGWRLHPYGAPFVGYRGAIHLINLWINEYVLKHG